MKVALMGMGGLDFFFSLFPVLFLMVFSLVFGLVLVVIIKEIRQWNKNNHSPRLTLVAQVVAKRVDMGRRRSNRNVVTSSKYYATFEVESGDRMELVLPGQEYGLLAEGDWGRLSFQGTRFLGFDRMA